MRNVWTDLLTPELVDARFGADVVTGALSTPRLYASPPVLDAASRLVASVVDAPDGKRLSAPLKVSVRLDARDPRDPRESRVDVACACRHARVCEHAVWLLVDVAYCPALRAALALGESTDAPVTELPRLRAEALEQRTLEERLSAWLPTRGCDDDWEIDVDASVLGGDGRAALLVRHRRPKSRALVPAREVLAARLGARHRQLVELTAPYHLDKNVLVATRGQASVFAHFLRQEIGVRADRFKTFVRFSRELARLRVEKDEDRLVARWYADEGALLGDAGATLLLAGPFPFLWLKAAHTFVEVSADVDLDAALGMSRVPTLPLGEPSRDRVGRALLLRGRGLGIAIPPPEVFGLPPLEKPTFELRLTGSPLDVIAELDAVYAVGKVPVNLDRDSDAERDGRDADAEQQALDAVYAAGFVASERGSRPCVRAAEDRAFALWETGLANLRASESPRFEVRVSASLTRTNVRAPVHVDVRVGTEAGWLDVELEFRAGALSVEKERMHKALLEGAGWVVLSDGSLAKISADVAALATEVAPLYEGRDRAHLPPHQFGRIARWLELADAPDARISMAIDPRAELLRERMGEVLRHPTPRLPSSLEATLRPYQLAGLAWLQGLAELRIGGVVADDMGLGKTLMTLALLAGLKEQAGPLPSLVVCPTSVAGNWVREAARFTPDLRAVVWASAGRSDIALGEFDLIVTTYGVLRRDVTILAKTRFRCVVIDEAQNAKNPASLTSRAARRLDAEMRLALTGTPIENRLSELWSLMTFANPGMLGTARDFEQRYEKPIGLRPDGAVARELRALVQPLLLRRTKAQVLRDLPPKTEIERHCVFGLRQRRAYDALALALREAVRRKMKLRKDARTRLSVLTAILRLRQMCCDPRLVDETARPEDSAKRAVFLDLVRELVSEGRRALVFSQFASLLSLWRVDLDAAKVSYEWLDGSTADRDAVVDRFQNGSASLFLVSLKAGGAGLNLTAADTVIHCDPWWNLAAEDQATARAHRLGQTQPVTVIRLVARGTIEDKIALLKRSKQELASAILEDTPLDQALLTVSEDDVDELLGEVEAELEDVEGDEPDLDVASSNPS